jgi:hypothetical protein
MSLRGTVTCPLTNHFQDGGQPIRRMVRFKKETGAVFGSQAMISRNGIPYSYSEYSAAA